MNHYSTSLLGAQLSLQLCAALFLGATASGAIAHNTKADCASSHYKVSKTKAMPNNYLKGTVKSAKTGMGVQVDYVFSSAAVDRSGLLQLTITRRGGGADATITIEPDVGLLVTEGLPSSPAQFNTGASYVLKIKPTTDGLRYINVFLKSGAMGESLAIPVQLGKDSNLQKPGAIQTTPDGQRVISIPAQ